MKQLVDIIEEIESGGDVNAHGDLGKAYGCMQIHQGTLDDFNRWNSTNYKLLDLMGEKGRQISRLIFQDYMDHYATEARLGRAVMDEDRARIWNGGPNGYKKSATRIYAWKYRKIVQREEVKDEPVLGGMKRSTGKGIKVTAKGVEKIVKKAKKILKKKK